MVENASSISFKAPSFDGTGHSLRNEQPPRDDVSVPGIDDDLHLLVKEVAIEHARSNHGWLTSKLRGAALASPALA